MTRSLSFEVRGIPAPQGSKRHVGRGILIESSKKVKPWREDVRAAALNAMGDAWTPLAGAVEVWVTFYLPAPKSLPKRINAPTKRPDLDKLARSTMDALTSAGVYLDDSKVTDLHVLKRYVGRNVMNVNAPGAAIDVEGLAEEDVR